MYQISVRSDFSSAHNLRHYKGKCEKLHGHNWQVEVFLESGRLNKEGMVLDFTEARKILKEILDILDHSYINEIPPFTRINPTSENIARFIFNKMKLKLKAQSLRVKKVNVWETNSSRASYYEK